MQVNQEALAVVMDSRLQLKKMTRKSYLTM